MIDIDDVDRTERGDGMTGFVLLCCLFIYYFVVSMMLYTYLSPSFVFFSSFSSKCEVGFHHVVRSTMYYVVMWCRYHAFLYQMAL